MSNTKSFLGSLNWKGLPNTSTNFDRWAKVNWSSKLADSDLEKENPEEKFEREYLGFWDTAKDQRDAIAMAIAQKNDNRTGYPAAYKNYNLQELFNSTVGKINSSTELTNPLTGVTSDSRNRQNNRQNDTLNTNVSQPAYEQIAALLAQSYKETTTPRKVEPEKPKKIDTDLILNDERAIEI